MAKTHKVMDIQCGKKQYFCIEDRSKVNWYYLYEKWYDNGWHRKRIAEYADMSSVLMHLLQINYLKLSWDIAG